MNLRLIVFNACVIFFFCSCTQKHEWPEEHESSKPLEKLMEGNKRFVSAHPIHPDESPERIKELKNEQHPFAVVVSCSDSRVSPELVFDQGLGDLFVIRTAGNVIGDYELGSIEYAVEHLHCKLVMVLGHENCGAVKAYLSHGTEKQHDHIETIVEYIKAENEEKGIPDSLKSNIDIAVKANILHGVHFLNSSEPILKPLVEATDVTIVGAIYDLDNGEVQLLNDIYQ